MDCSSRSGVRGKRHRRIQKGPSSKNRRIRCLNNVPGFPVLFQYHVKKLIYEFCPGLGILTYQYESLLGAPTPNMTNAYSFTTKEFSFNIGCGYSFNEKWYLGLGYSHSLEPVRKQIPDITKQVYSRVFALTVSKQTMFNK